MGLANCKECGKLYVQNPAGICPECYQLLEEQESKVAAYLRNNQRASIVEVHEATGVPEKVILKMIKKGRIVGDIRLEYPCETCGKPISEGRVCAECGHRVLSQLKNEPRPAAKPQEPTASKAGGGLHTTFIKR
jgi:DNA-directed RNA polymerase subunit RPC12/RpoP